MTGTRLLLLASWLLACTPGRIGEQSPDVGAAERPDASVSEPPDAGEVPDGGPVFTDSAGKKKWTDEVQPALATRCGACHLGERFAFASLARSGTAFTEVETEANYQRFLRLLSFDAPRHSRLVVKLVPDTDAEAIVHAGPRLEANDPLLATLRGWLDTERAERRPDCGLAAPKQYLAYVEQPELFWALERDPLRKDHGLRDRARIVLQPLEPGTLKPSGAAIDFLDGRFCGADGRCDFGNLSASYDGTKLVFECRLSLEPSDWVDETRWNICLADIGPDGKAVNPRFLLPKELRHKGVTVSRSDPLGLYTSTGLPLKGPYDPHFQVRRRADTTPVFSPDGTRVYFASEGPEPRSGANATQSYHGYEHLNHIVAVKLDGSDRRTIYVNEGGSADFPFFLANGNVAFHTWNLERMDRHLYTQATADGDMELPVLLGRTQGPNMWGKATQLADGTLLGMTGRRRAQIDNFIPFAADHTLGTGLDGLPSLRLLDPAVFAQVPDYGFCYSPPTGTGCVADRFYADPSYSPDGRALIVFNPDPVYVAQGEQMFLLYGQGADEQQKVASLASVVPKKLGISLIDAKGKLERLLDPPSGKALRYPVWVGKRQPPRIQPWETREDVQTAELHIADFPLWLSFRFLDGQTKSSLAKTLSTITSVRVLEKAMDDNACLNDNRYYRLAVNSGAHDHPTHLGINNATGFTRLSPPQSAGGDAYGDVPLEADRSVALKLPAGKPLLLQGVDAQGHVVWQRSRMLSLAPGKHVDTSVKAGAYKAQCASCHGSVSDAEPYAALKDTDKVPWVAHAFDTEAAAKAPVDLTSAAVKRKPLTYLSVLRPLLDRSCVSCHSGAAPKGELSLEKTYSADANYPAGKWATNGWANPDYLAFMQGAPRTPGYNFSVSFAWALSQDESAYSASGAWSAQVSAHKPLADLAPWDPGYQNLFAPNGSRWAYLGSFFNPNFGRADQVGGFSRDSFLVEVLTGRDLDPTRSVSGTDHQGLLTEAEAREVMALIDVGFPYAATCAERKVPSGPNAGKDWGDPRIP